MKKFNILLNSRVPIAPLPGTHDYVPDLDGITSLLSDACESLEDTGQIRFEVIGFGEERWPVDVGTDLAIVIEQIPAVLDALARGESATLGFYEQGVERVLDMMPHGGEVTVYCGSMLAWQPEPNTIHMPIDELQAMLQQFLESFADLVRQRRPDLFEHPWFRSWYLKRGS